MQIPGTISKQLPFLLFNSFEVPSPNYLAAPPPMIWYT